MVNRFLYGAAVKTPIGPGLIVARLDSEPVQYLVSLGRRQFSAEQWAKLCPSNAPCIYRVYDEGELEAA